jgi:hypothetical protein
MNNLMELIKQAGFRIEVLSPTHIKKFTTLDKIIRADERSECAKLCEEDAKKSREFAEPFAARIAEDLAKEIIARGE